MMKESVSLSLVNIFLSVLILSLTAQNARADIYDVKMPQSTKRLRLEEVSGTKSSLEKFNSHKSARLNTYSKSSRQRLEKDEVDEALTALKSFKELRKYEGLTTREKQIFRSNFLPEMKNLQIETNAQMNFRAQSITGKVFAVHNLLDQCETVIVRSYLPTVFTWKLTFVTLTTKTLELLTDEEIIALTAHEVGHLYYVDELKKARDTNNPRLARIIELKADVVALETLDILKIPRSNLLSAVKKLIEARNKLGVKSLTEMSPSVENRARLLDEYGRRLANKTLFNSNL